MKKTLRYALRHTALNAFGKKISELSSEQLKTILETLWGQYLPLASNREAFKETFKIAFKVQLKQIKENENGNHI